jgi:hypothetical protein
MAPVGWGSDGAFSEIRPLVGGVCYLPGTWAPFHLGRWGLQKGHERRAGPGPGVTLFVN